jgi:hypothetical protein
MKEFKVIQIKQTEFDGRMYGDSYGYISGIMTDERGNIKITTCRDILEAMRFNDWKVLDERENKLRNQILELVKSYFPKKNHTISYHDVKVVY